MSLPLAGKWTSYLHSTERAFEGMSPSQRIHAGTQDVEVIGGFSVDELAKIRWYLYRRYKGVFSDEAIESHLRDYVGYPFSDAMVQVLAIRHRPGQRVLDLGAGFGSFVLIARQHGFDAIGIELAETEIAFARLRLNHLRPQDEPSRVYIQGSAYSLNLPDESFDAVTMWNVIEHIVDAAAVLRRAWQLLRPHGSIYIICPNYMTFRAEAHYHVAWCPCLPRALAARYLRLRRKDPAYFEKEIFYRSNWGVLRMLRRSGFEVHDFGNTVSMRFNISNLGKRPRAMAMFYNPFKDSVVLSARKIGELSAQPGA
jgi:MPBQ/MSBQ methyltransferase